MDLLNAPQPEVATVKTEIEESFLIAPSTKFNVLPNESVTLLHNTPVSVSYQQSQHMTNGGQSISFQVKTSESLFIDRGVTLEMTIPLLLDSAQTITGMNEDNYLEKANYFRDLAVRQFGLIAAMESLEVKLNGDTITNITNVAKAFETVSEYYDSDSVDSYFPYSQPDRFTNYDYYDGTDLKKHTIKTLSEISKSVSISNSVMAEENVFTGGYSSKYNTRKPVISWSEASTANVLKGTITMFAFLPFTMFGLPDSDYSLYGINDLIVNIGLKSDFVKHLFVTKKADVANAFEDRWTVSLDTDRTGEHVSNLHMKYYSSPDYIRNHMMDKVSGTVKPYRIGYTNIMFPAIQTENAVVALKPDVTIYGPQHSLGTIPKSVYLSVHAVKDPTSPYKTPNFKGRIKTIHAVVGSSETTIGPSAIRIYNIAKANGLQRDYESAMLTNGYVVKLDLTKDLSVGSYLIGANVPTTMSFTVTFDSLAEETVNYELRTIFAFNSQIVYKDRQFKTTQTLVLAQTLFDIQNQAAALYGEFTPQMMMIGGAGFFGKVWKGIKNAASSGAKAGWNYIKNNPDKVVGMLTKLVGAGGNRYSSNVVGGSANSTLILGAGNTKQNIFK